MKECDITLQEAADRIGVQFEALMKQFQEDKVLFTKLDPSLAQQLKGHVYGLECWVVGNLYWSFHSKRYFGDKHDNVMRTRVVELRVA